MKFTNVITAFGLALVHSALAAQSADWRSRSIYQVMTDRFARTDGSTSATCDTSVGLYCGGTWQGLINKLDYIQGMGFDAVWISPVTKQIEGKTAYGEAYHGYWQQDLYSVNSHFGSASDLMKLSHALHGRGMYLMVDIVVNHMAWNGNVNSIDYSKLSPFNSKSNYHFPYCTIDYNNKANMTQITNCWMGDQKVPLADVRTEDASIQNAYGNWISSLVSNYSIDGLRLDTVMQVNTGFWDSFQKAANTYMVGEIYDANANFVCNYQNYVPGVLNYGTYFPLISAFKSTSGDMSALAASINQVKSSCKDSTLLGSFSENHDRPRFAALNGDMAAASNVIAYTILADGIPILYQGQEQHYAAYGSNNGGNDPYNREALWFSNYNTQSTLYLLTQKLNAARKNAIVQDSTYLSYKNGPIYQDTTTIAMRKGKMVTVLSNKGSSGDAYTQKIPAGYTAGTQVVDVLTCNTLTAASDGSITVPMGAGAPRVYYPAANATKICAATYTRSSTKTMKTRLLPRLTNSAARAARAEA